MALDPDVAAQVAHLFDATLAQVLSGEVAGPPAASRLRRDDVHIVNGTVPGPGGPVPVRIYRPAASGPAASGPAASGPAEGGPVEGETPAGASMPCLVWAHGGGWQFGGLDMPEADSVAQIVAATLPGVVVSVDYRLAPAHPFPAPRDDVAAALRWATTPAGAAQGIDPERVALGGASAGAHLALSAALAHVAAGRPPAALLFAYPVVEPVRGPYPATRPPECPPLLWLDAEAMTGMFAALVDDTDAPPPGAAPGRDDPAGLPPTLLTATEYDALAEQGRWYLDRLRRAGVEAILHEVEGVLHGYLNTVGDSVAADAALSRHVDWLRSVLDP